MASRLPLALSSVVLLSVITAGCAKACKNDHPYVPYSIGDAAGPAPTVEADAAVVAAPPDAAPHFAEQAAEKAPEGATRLRLGELTIDAPKGRVLLLGLARDIDGDGVTDALAVVRSANAPFTSEALFFKGKSGALEAPVPLGSVYAVPNPDCAPAPRLSVVGARSVYVEQGSSCTRPPDIAATRTFVVYLFSPEPRVHVDGTVVDPASAPKLTIDADGADADHDGVDDVVLRVSVEGGNPPFEPGPRFTATLRWLDRPAGMSRERDEPEASLRALLTPLLQRANKGREAPQAIAQLRQLRALYTSLCAEGGTPRLTSVLGASSVPCGSLRVLEDAAFAEVRAQVSAGDALRAIAALDRTERSGLGKPQRLTEAQGWITQLAPVSQALSVRAVGAVPATGRGRTPSWGALAFETSGKLLVRTAAGVVRVDPLSGDEGESDVLSWPLDVAPQTGTPVWLDAFDPCNGGALHAAFSAKPGAEPREVLLPVPSGPRCAGPREAVTTVPIAWGARGLQAIVAGEPLLVAADLARATPVTTMLEEPVTPGAPRSPNGKVWVVTTPQGLVIRGQKTRIYRGKELDGGYAELRDCAVSDDATRVACVRGGRAYIGTWEPL